MDKLYQFLCGLSLTCAHPSDTKFSTETILPSIAIGALGYLLISLHPRVKETLERYWDIAAVAAASLTVYLLNGNRLALSTATIACACLLVMRLGQSNQHNLKRTSRFVALRLGGWKKASRITTLVGATLYTCTTLLPYAENMVNILPKDENAGPQVTLFTLLGRKNGSSANPANGPAHITDLEWQLFSNIQDILRSTLLTLADRIEVRPEINNSNDFRNGKVHLPLNRYERKELLESFQLDARANGDTYHFVIQTVHDAMNRKDGIVNYEFKLLKLQLPKKEHLTPIIHSAMEESISIRAHAYEVERVTMVGSAHITRQLLEQIQIEEGDMEGVWRQYDTEFRTYYAIDTASQARGKDWKGHAINRSTACAPRDCLELWLSAYDSEPSTPDRKEAAKVTMAVVTAQSDLIADVLRTLSEEES